MGWLTRPGRSKRKAGNPKENHLPHQKFELRDAVNSSLYVCFFFIKTWPRKEKWMGSGCDGTPTAQAMPTAW
jgi:hypothetical protein